MPAQPRWLAELPRIRRALTQLSTPFLDRVTIQRLFGLQPRQANYLMRSLGGYRIGPASVVNREELLQKLDQMAAPRGVPGAATARKARVLEALDALARQARPRRVLLPQPPRQTGGNLPAGIRISASGEMTLCFSSPEHLLGLVLALAQSASSDFAAFAAGLSDRQSGNGVCTDSGDPPTPDRGQDPKRQAAAREGPLDTPTPEPLLPRPEPDRNAVCTDSSLPQPDRKTPATEEH